MTTVPEVLSVIGTAYLVLTYIGYKLFPRTEVVSSSDPRLQQRHYGSTTDSHAKE